MIQGSKKKDRLIEQEIDGYRILSVLGRGGMGVVYKAEKLGLGRLTALKFINPTLAENEAFVRRFRLEARALGQIHHPNIVIVYDLRQVGEGLYIAMEYVEGETLADWLEARGAMPWQDALPIMRQLLSALTYAHGRGVVHRDIKPRNIMLARDGAVKMMDFGLAKIVQDPGDTTLTLAQAGTPCYMSPEQARGEGEVDHRSDLFSLGMTFYETLTGRLPFDKRAGQYTILKAIIDDKFPAPSKFRASIPRKLAKIIMKALAKHPVKRYQHAAEMLADLEAFAAEKQKAAPTEGRLRLSTLLPRRRNGGSAPVQPAAPPAPADPVVRHPGPRAVPDDTVEAVPDLMETRVLGGSAEAEAPTIAELPPVREAPAPPPRPPRPPRLRQARAAALARWEGAKAAGHAGWERFAQAVGVWLSRVGAALKARLGGLGAVLMKGMRALRAVPKALGGGLSTMNSALLPARKTLRAAPAALMTGLGTATGAVTGTVRQHRTKLRNVLLVAVPAVVLITLGGELIVPALTDSAATVGSEAGSTPGSPAATSAGQAAEDGGAEETPALAEDTEVPGEEAAAAADSTVEETPGDSLAQAEDPAALTGSLRIDSTPRGAEIFIDGVLSGITPRTIPEVQPGQHTVTLSLGGHEAHTEAVAVEADERQTVRATLAPLPGELVVGVIPWGQLYIDGKMMLSEVSVMDTLSLPAGSHTVTVVHPRHGRWQRSVTITPGASSPVFAVDFNKQVKVTVVAQDTEGNPMDRGEIFVDGQPKGPVPREVSVRVGLRKIEVRAEGYVLAGAPTVRNFEQDQTEPIIITLRPHDQ